MVLKEDVEMKVFLTTKVKTLLLSKLINVMKVIQSLITRSLKNGSGIFRYVSERNQFNKFKGDKLMKTDRRMRGDHDSSVSQTDAHLYTNQGYSEPET